MNRPAWTPEDDAQQRLVNELIAAFKAVDALEEKAWRDLKRASKEQGVSLQYVIDRIDRSRSTAYRRLGELS